MIRVKMAIWDKFHEDSDMKCLIQVILEFLQEHSSMRGSKYDTARNNERATQDTE
jgi:hypothetical protein